MGSETAESFLEQEIFREVERFIITRTHEKFAFCTTIEPLLSLPYIEKKLNEQWLAEYLAISGMVDAVDSSYNAL